MLYIRVLYVLERSTLSFNCFFAAELEKFKCLMKSLPATVTAYLTLPLQTPLPRRPHPLPPNACHVMSRHIASPQPDKWSMEAHTECIPSCPRGNFDDATEYPLFPTPFQIPLHPLPTTIVC